MGSSKSELGVRVGWKSWDVGGGGDVRLVGGELRVPRCGSREDPKFGGSGKRRIRRFLNDSQPNRERKTESDGSNSGRRGLWS